MEKIKIDTWKKAISGWVFLSHSSLDIERVKTIRNYLEESQFNAIMFFLKCLDDEEEQKQIEKLLECEIKNRNIFIHCKSNNSLQSKWVNWEINKAKKENKLFLEIDLDKLEYQKCIELSKIDILVRYSTLYFIFSMSDIDKIKKLKKKLEGFKILNNFKSENILANEPIKTSLENMIKEIKQKGFILLFISENSKKSSWFWTEKQIALDKNARIINIILDKNISIDEFPVLKNFKTIQYQNSNQLYDELYNYIKQEFEKELSKFEERLIQ